MLRSRLLVGVVALLGLGLVLGACSDEDEGDVTVQAPTTTTTAFDGSTTPTSVASDGEIALLTDVTIEDGVVVFTFRDGTPGYDLAYVDPPILEDASGEEVEVAGDAFLSVHMAPASGVDLSGEGESFEETYTGPDRIAGSADGPVVEVVRTGDFEANLTWVIGFDEERAYRVETDGSTMRVAFATA